MRAARQSGGNADASNPQVPGTSELASSLPPQLGNPNTHKSLMLQAWIIFVVCPVIVQGLATRVTGRANEQVWAVVAVVVLLTMRGLYRMWPTGMFRYLSFTAITWEDLSHNTYATPWFGVSVVLAGFLIGAIEAVEIYRAGRWSNIVLDIFIAVFKIQVCADRKDRNPSSVACCRYFAPQPILCPPPPNVIMHTRMHLDCNAMALKPPPPRG